MVTGEMTSIPPSRMPRAVVIVATTTVDVSSPRSRESKSELEGD
jgi:hypothetical protein